VTVNETMQVFSYLFAPSGRLKPQSFVYGALAVYLFGLASHLLTTPDVLRRFGLWLFIAVQALLVWVWFCLHGKRLHDAGRSNGLALGIALLYLLSAVLLLVVADSFFGASSGLMGDANGTAALYLLLMLYIAATLIGSPHYDLVSLAVAILIFMAFVPIVLALGFTYWAATRPSADIKISKP
jgi:uncharacterized membrane protein YhaH (DUF805 family)